jgi:uncharacterized damage-inducible protein DinB
MDELRRLFDYNRWANLRLLAAADSLTPEELRRHIESSFSSVLATLAHALGAEWVWLERWKGKSPTSLPDGSTLDSPAALRARWDEVWRDQQALLAGLSDGDETRLLTYELFSGDSDTRPLGELMRHVVNHATYHRGQLATMLRQLGRVPPSTDYVRWLRETA